jgi:hypothetical protein
VSVEDSIRRTLVATASSVETPSIDLALLRSRAVRASRRRRAATAVVAVVAVVLMVLLLPRTFVRGDHPQPIGPPKEPHSIRTGVANAVWYDAAGLHHGDTVVDLAPGVTPWSLALVQDGVLYRDGGSSDIWYRPWSGKARVVGQSAATPSGSGVALGPGSDAQGTTAAWFDDDDLVMYDTDTGAEIARKSQPGRLPLVNRENAMGTRIDYVDRERVVWSAGDGGIYSFDRPSGAVTELGRYTTGQPYVVDVVPGLRATNSNGRQLAEVRLTTEDGTLLYHGGVGTDPFRFSPDGRYLVVIAEPTAASPAASYGPVVVDTESGRPAVPMKSRTYPWIGWSYGHTLMYLQQRKEDEFGAGRLVVYDATTHKARYVATRGTVVLPAN